MSDWLPPLEDRYSGGGEGGGLGGGDIGWLVAGAVLVVVVALCFPE